MGFEDTLGHSPNVKKKYQLIGEPKKLSKVEVHHLLLIEQSDRKVNQILGNSYSAKWEIKSACST